MVGKGVALVCQKAELSCDNDFPLQKEGCRKRQEGKHQALQLKGPSGNARRQKVYKRSIYAIAAEKKV
jgi:hypothetical protein